MSARPKTDSCWSLSLRGRGCNDGYSSDDESEDGDKTALTTGSDGPSPTSDEARLLGELDLASRADAAAYKPNPWSIAKVNASARPSKPLAATHKKSKPSSKVTTKATVLDLLRTQPKKKNAPPRTTASSAVTAPKAFESVAEPSLSNTHSDCNPEDGAHIPSDETLVDVSYQPDVLVKPGKSPLVHSPTTITPSSAARRLDFGADSHGFVTRTDNVNRHPAAGFPDGSPGPTQSATTSRTVSGLLGHRIAPDGSHISAPAGNCSIPTSNSPLLRDSPRQDLRSALFKQPRPAARPTDTVGPHPAGTRPAATVLPSSSYQGVTTSRSPGKPQLFLRSVFPLGVKRIHFTAYNQHHQHQYTGLPEQQPWKREWRSPDLHSLPSQGKTFHQTPPTQQMPPVLPKREYSPILPDAPAYNHSRDQPQGAEVTNHPKPWLQRAMNASTTSHPSRTSATTIPPPVKMRPRPIRRSPSPSPPLPPFPRYCPSPPARRREQQHDLFASKKPQPKRDAYDAFGSPHASWSTLPAKKPRATGKDKTRDVASGKFKIPPKLALASKGRFAREEAGKENGALGQACGSTRRRVTTYLPPPPKNASTSHQEGDHSEAETNHRERMSTSAIPAAPSPGFQPLTIRRAVPPTMTLPAYKYEPPRTRFSRRPEAPTQLYHDTQSSPGPSRSLLSPVASPSHDRAVDDLPDWRTSLTFDEAGVSHRYRSVRRGVAEVRTQRHLHRRAIFHCSRIPS